MVLDRFLGVSGLPSRLLSLDSVRGIAASISSAKLVIHKKLSRSIIVSVLAFFGNRWTVILQLLFKLTICYILPGRMSLSLLIASSARGLNDVLHARC